MGVRGFKFPEQSTAGKVPVVILIAHSLTAESLKKSGKFGARSLLSKVLHRKIGAFP
jgi:hypothetical protein